MHPVLTVTHVVEICQLRPLRGVVEERVVLLCEGLADGVVVGVQRHDGEQDDGDRDQVGEVVFLLDSLVALCLRPRCRPRGRKRVLARSRSRSRVEEDGREAKEEDDTDEDDLNNSAALFTL